MSAAAGNVAKYHTPKGENRLATKTGMNKLYEMSGFKPSNRNKSRFWFAKPLSAAAEPFRPAGSAGAAASQRKSRRNMRRNRRNTRRANRR